MNLTEWNARLHGLVIFRALLDDDVIAKFVDLTDRMAAAPTVPPCFRHWRRSSLLLLTRGGLGMAENFISSPEAPLQGELAAKQTERLYEDGPAHEPQA